MPEQDQTYDDGRARNLEALLRALVSRITELDGQGKLLDQAGELMRLIGDESAPVEVTEFGDFECPQCGRFATLTEPDVRSRLVAGGQIRYRFIDYPLDMHRNTWNASIAAACADEQGRFWEMHDAIFAAQDQWDGLATNNPNKILKQIGEPLVGDKPKFDSCIDAQRTKPKVQAHWKLAMDIKAPGTPTFLFGNQLV